MHVNAIEHLVFPRWSIVPTWMWGNVSVQTVGHGPWTDWWPPVLCRIPPIGDSTNTYCAAYTTGQWPSMPVFLMWYLCQCWPAVWQYSGLSLHLLCGIDWESSYTRSQPPWTLTSHTPDRPVPIATNENAWDTWRPVYHLCCELVEKYIKGQRLRSDGNTQSIYQW